MTQTTMRRGPYAKTKARRADIIRIALELFSEQGYNASSMRDVARRAGMSQAGLQHHFKSKPELLIETLQARDRLTGVAADAAGMNPLERILAIVEDNSKHRDQVQLFAILSVEATAEDHPAHEYFQERAKGVIALWQAYLEEAKTLGVVASGLDTESAARLCHAVMNGLQVQWLHDPTTDMVGLYRSFLEGIRQYETEPKANGQRRRVASDGESGS